jgi:Methane oxygenase PmoA
MTRSLPLSAAFVMMIHEATTLSCTFRDPWSLPMRRSSPIFRLPWTGWLVALMIAGTSKADLPPILTVSGNGRALGETPIVVQGVQNMQPGNYVLATSDGKTTLRANASRNGTGIELDAILESVPAQGDLEFKVVKGPLPPEPSTGVELIPNGKRIEVRIDGKPFTEYIPDDGPKPYFFPVIGPSGAMMTRSFPMKKVEGEKYDHPHQRSLWFTHGSVNKVDFWSETPGHGRIVETSRTAESGGIAMGLIRTTDDWLGPDGKKICEDNRLVRVFATRQGRVLDFNVSLRASEGPVTFGDTKEGMFGVRVATSMDVTSKKGGRIVNAEGVEDKAAWGKPSPWVDYTGPVDGKTVGIAILNDPSSFRYPTTWHVRDYGLFAANPFGWHDFGQKDSGEFVLAKYRSIQFRYRVILHDGDTASANLPAAFDAYANPPKAVID